MTFLTDRNPREIAGDVLAGLVGLVFALTPWFAGFVPGAAAWNAWIVGAAAVVVALVAVFQTVGYLPSAYIALGVWAVIAPWALGFSAVTGALYAHLTAGALLVVIGAYEAWRSSRNGPMTA